MICINCGKEFIPAAKAKLGKDHDPKNTELRTKCTHCNERYYAYVPTSPARLLAFSFRKKNATVKILARMIPSWASVRHAQALIKHIQSQQEPA